MKYMCKSGRNLVIRSEDIMQTRFFLELYDPGDLEN